MKQVPLNSGIFLLCALLAFSSCARKKETLPLSSDTIMTPYQDFDSTTLFFYEGGLKRWKLEADRMRKPLFDTGCMIVTPVTLTYYDSLGNISTRVLSDSGSTTPALASFTVWGNVFIRNKDSLTIKTEKLWWVKDRRKVESNTFVQIETAKGDILRGKGLDAVEDFSRFTFKSQVSGKFPDFKRRMEENDDKMF
jgi:LPS export ABC transporter protein LptC